MSRKTRRDNYCWFFFDDTRQWKRKHASDSVLIGWKNKSKKKKPSSLSNIAALPTNDIRDMFKRVEKQNEEKPRDQSNDDLTEGKSNTILSD